MANVLFTNVRVIDATGAQPYQGEVLVQGNRINRVTRSGTGVRSAPVGGVTVVDAAGAHLDDGDLAERLRARPLIGNGAGGRQRLREDAGARRSAGTGLRLRRRGRDGEQGDDDRACKHRRRRRLARVSQ